ncbi:hypothetical protein GQX73_g5391 [Xylaria multiplex]|uniref:Uncharacterized protein n=1 Tax=Xylaria multiplex TaxID=323545 RepID=A0A7C8N735_9PEZI|nr:hypothetical protein GQX73_g5391 [Xylaria multiplex]
MASDIHKKRTGRGLKVSEEIVLKEEMYEEMEDDMPRSYQALAAHLQTDSPELNHRVSAYIASQTAMATMVKYNEIGRMFSEAFPRAASYSQQTPESHYMSPLMNHRNSTPSLTGTASSSVNRNLSTSAQSHSSIADSSGSNMSPDQTPSAVSAPTPDLSPATVSTDTTESASTLYQVPQSAFSNLPLDPQLVQQCTSSFTSELSNEVKMMANIDMNDPMAMHFLGEGTPTVFPTLDENAGGIPSLYQLDAGGVDGQELLKSPNEYYDACFPPIEAPRDFQDAPSPHSFSQLGTPGCSGSGIEGWESFVDYDTEQEYNLPS